MSGGERVAHALDYARNYTRPGMTSPTTEALTVLADEVERLTGMLDRTEEQIHEPGGFIDEVVDGQQETEHLRADLASAREVIAKVAELADRWQSAMPNQGGWAGEFGRTLAALLPDDEGGAS